MSNESLSITDNRTGKTYQLQIEHGTIRALELRQIKVDDDDFGLMTYDPGFSNTAACKSRITYIDGDKGILRHRGYAIEDLATRADFLGVAYLLINGELPNTEELDAWHYEITHHTFLNENVKKFMDGFRYDAHPMGVFVSTVAGLSTFYPDARQISDPAARGHEIVRLIAKVPTIAAFAYRHMIGLPFVYPDNDLSYSGNFLQMMFNMSGKPYTPDPILEKALNDLFILHADHEQNCSATAMRSVGSSGVDPYSAMAAAAAALYGPSHGGANEAVLRMLREIGDVKNIPDYIQRVKDREVRLMGFGHRVYKNYDPRARLIKQTAHDVFEVTGRNPLIDIAVELERIALEDDYFVSHKLYPNVDFYSGIIYEAMGFPVEMFPVLFAIGRTPGWLAQWEEQVEDGEQRIARPRQIYLGEDERPFLALDER